MPPVDPDLEIEHRLFSQGCLRVVGVDEVGRGAWAGPVSVGALLLTPETPVSPPGIRDSKMLSPKRRSALDPLIRQWAPACAVGSASNEECDLLGMRAAVALAASRALEGLAMSFDAVIVDGPVNLLTANNGAFEALVAGHRWRSNRPLVEPVVKADQKCLSVAAASVIAKVARDAEMAGWAGSYPEFGFEKNVGYPAPIHRAALETQGLTPLHRRSWSFAEGMDSR